MTAVVDELATPAEAAAADELYRHVFGGGLNVRLLIALAAHGGHLLGARTDGRLVGLALSFLARDDGRVYQYSQTLAVAADARGRGIGRLLKSAQRRVTLADGLDLLRWVFDPMQARNGHFNLDVIGGRITRLHRDFYGAAAPEADAGERTDRCLVDWELRGPAPELAAPELPAVPPGECIERTDLTLIGIPAAWREYRAATGSAGAARVRAAVVDAMAGALQRGLVGLACRRTGPDTATYVFGADPLQ